MTSPHTDPPAARAAQRRHLLDARDRFAASPEASAAAAMLAARLCDVLAQLEPERLGLYWPVRSEFNAPAAVAADSRLANVPLALPFARRAPVEMEFRAWHVGPPGIRDDFGIASGEGPVVVPDVVVVPCVGYTAAGYRLGYGGGYFDRWLARHPAATTVGVAWSFARLTDEAFGARPHDLPLTLVITEQGAG